MAYKLTEQINDPAVARELQNIANSLNTIIVGRFVVLHSAPAKPQDGQAVICDGVNWNPIGDGVKRPIWYDKTAGLWKIFA
jgi:hypothetical protein